MNLRKGDVNNQVKKLQKMLTENGYDIGPVDGWFGAKTEKGVKAFQKERKLKVDGIVGKNTWAALGVKKPPSPKYANLHLDSAPADPYMDGYDSFRLREDVARAYTKVYKVIKKSGGIIPSSGGIRSLWAKVSSGRSATSFHYTGRALDIHIYSAMKNPRTDPLVVTKESGNKWLVYAKGDKGDKLTLEGIKWAKGKAGAVKVSGRFINLTELFKKEGFNPIRARRSWPRSYISSEWWHFQYETGLKYGLSTFGNELLKIYRKDQLVNTPPWKYREYVYKGSYFGRKS